MLRMFWIRSANIRINPCKTDFCSTLQLDHRYGGRDAHLQLRGLANAKKSHSL